MPDLFSQFGRPGSANGYMWPDMGGSFGFGKQGLMGAPSGLPTQAQGLGIPGGPGAPGAATSMAPPPLDFSKIGGASGAPDMSALGTPPAAAPPIGGQLAGAPPPAAGLPEGNPMMMEGQVTGAANNPMIAGQVSAPLPGPGGWRAGAMGAISPANYPSMVNQAMMFGKRAF